MIANTTWQPALYLGLDGGGTKTLAVVVDATGAERGRAVAGSANHQAVGVARAVAHIRMAVAGALAQAGVVAPDQAPCVAGWLGIAGLDGPADHDLLLPHLRALADSVHLTNDAELPLAALPDGAGVALVAGTGSIALGRNAQGRFARAGGWGHLLGDEGSGYDIGRQALQAVVRAADGRARLAGEASVTALSPLILRRWAVGCCWAIRCCVWAFCAVYAATYASLRWRWSMIRPTAPPAPPSLHRHCRPRWP
ncbi:MAG: BadF/BadG/BcrA/BcrD ATPase family protein [Ktedonobacterales bacterium]